MPLKDDDFSKTNKPEEYLNIIEELQELQDDEKEKPDYDFEIEEEEEE
ncbi:MAG: hypothetical protein ACK5LC_10100 [Coprobacillaceae bacterium]